MSVGDPLWYKYKFNDPCFEQESLSDFFKKIADKKAFQNKFKDIQIGSQFYNIQSNKCLKVHEYFYFNFYKRKLEVGHQEEMFFMI